MTMDLGVYLIESPTAVVFVATGEAGEERGPAIWAEAWLWVRGTGEVESVRIALKDVALMPRGVDPIEFLFDRAEYWAKNRVASAGLVLAPATRRRVPDEFGSDGLAATLLGLAIDAPELTRRIETDSQWVDLEDAALEATEGAEAVVVLRLGEPS